MKDIQRFKENFWRLNIEMRNLVRRKNHLIKDKEWFNEFLFYYFDAFHNFDRDESLLRGVQGFLDDFINNDKLLYILWEDGWYENNIEQIKISLEGIINSYKGND